MPGTERHNSSSSEDASTPPVRQVLQDGTELIPTRSVKVTAPKPAGNPLQFIKVGPCDLYKAAQEQIKKVEEIKKVKETVKEESEDWQSNLDNWKCSRRKRQEHIIDRVVEVKKIELEEQERNRRRGKTLTEMMEERTQKGIGPRKSSLLSYPVLPDDDNNDLTDLGISIKSPDEKSTCDDEANEKTEGRANGDSHAESNGSNGHGDNSPADTEEYTYERAIQGYKSFAEKKIKPRISPPKKETGAKIGEKLNELEQVRLRSNSVNDVDLPKVDIHKRRSLFEVIESAETKSPSVERVTRELGSTNIVKARLSSLERGVEPPTAKTVPRPQEIVNVTIKDRLSELEKQKADAAASVRRISNGDISNVSLKERLTSLEQHQRKEQKESSSDEEVAHKELLSPISSDREVSSPIVSENLVKGDGDLKMVEGGEGLECNNTVELDSNVDGEDVNGKEPELKPLDGEDKSEKEPDTNPEVGEDENVKEPDAKPEDGSLDITVEVNISVGGDDNMSSMENQTDNQETDKTNEIKIHLNQNVSSVDKDNETNRNDEHGAEDKNSVTHETEKTDTMTELIKTSDQLDKSADKALKAKVVEVLEKSRKIENVEVADNVADLGKVSVPKELDVKKAEEPIADEVSVKADQNFPSEDQETSKGEKSEIGPGLDMLTTAKETIVSVELTEEKAANESKQASNHDTTVENVSGDNKTENPLEKCKVDKMASSLESEQGVEVDNPADNFDTIEMIEETTVPVTSTDDNYSEESNLSAILDQIDVAKENCDTTTIIEETVVVSDDQGPVLVSESSVSQCFLDNHPSPQQLSVTKKTKKITVRKPKLRVRKLTPIMSAPKAMLSPVKAPGDLTIIAEDTPMKPSSSAEEGLLSISEDGLADTNITEDTGSGSAGQPTVQGAETSESGIDMEESSLYTDENIDEVLGDDDEDDQSEPENGSRFDEEEQQDRYDDIEHQESCDEQNGFDRSIDRREQEAVTRFDQLISLSDDRREERKPQQQQEYHQQHHDEDVKIMPKPVEDKTPSEEPKKIVVETFKEEIKSVVESSTLVDISVPVENKMEAFVPNYENIVMSGDTPVLALTGEVVALSFPLTPSSCVEPPKEKPPPPPPMSDEEEEEAPTPPPKTSLRRLDSTKRIKKEIRKKRSDFLGIEGANDDSYLEPQVDVAPPPDMMMLLQEERRMDQQLYRQSICSEADSNENDIRPNPVDRLDKALYMDQGLYRQSICSESDSNHETAESRDSGVELDRHHGDELCWAKQPHSPTGLSEPHSRQNSEPYGNTSVTSEEDEITKKEREIIEVLEKEEEWRYGKTLSGTEPADIGEKLAVKLRELEQEKLQLEWARAEEEGRRMADQERIEAKETLLRQQETSSNINNTSEPIQDNLRSARERLEQEQLEMARVRQQLLRQQTKPDAIARQPDHPRQGPMNSNLRYSMPNLQDETRPPQSPNRAPQTWGRAPSAENLLSSQQMNNRTPNELNHRAPSAETVLSPQQMTRSTLQALSAVPRSRIVAGEAWMQPKRKENQPKSAYNYQHWLIQEAEHRRITEQQKRADQSRRSLPAQLRSPSQYPAAIPPAAQYSPVAPPSAQYNPVAPPPTQYNPVSPPSSQYSPAAPPSVQYNPAGVPNYHPVAPSHRPHPAHHPVNGVYSPSQPPVNGVVHPPMNGINHAHPRRLNHSLPPPSHHTVGLPPPNPHAHVHPSKPLPDAVIQTLTQRVQNKTSPKRRVEERQSIGKPTADGPLLNGEEERMLSVSGKKKCSHCGNELGRGAAMVIESLRLFYHIDCFKCCVCHTQLGDGLMGTDVRVRNNKLHCHNCYSSDDGGWVCVPTASGERKTCRQKLAGQSPPNQDSAIATRQIPTVSPGREPASKGPLNEACPGCNLLGIGGELRMGMDSSSAIFIATVDLYGEELAEAFSSDKSLESNRIAEVFSCSCQRMPPWFISFFKQYQRSEERRLKELQALRLNVIEFEIKKYKLLQSYFTKLK